MVRDLAAAGRPQIKTTGDDVRIEFGDPKAFGTSLVDTVRLLAWANPQSMEAKLCADIDAMPEPLAPISVEERSQRIGELTDAIEALERQEEALIERAFATGTYVIRRSNADPRAVLGVTAVRTSEGSGGMRSISTRRFRLLSPLGAPARRCWC